MHTDIAERSFSRARSQEEIDARVNQVLDVRIQREVDNQIKKEAEKQALFNRAQDCPDCSPRYGRTDTVIKDPEEPFSDYATCTIQLHLHTSCSN